MNEDDRAPVHGEHEVYLLRIWCEFDGPRPVWRGSVLHDQSQRRYFATPEALLTFLTQRLHARQPTSTQANPPATPDP